MVIENLYREFLKEHLVNKNKHDVGKVLDVLPFLSKRTRAIRGNFGKVLGEYIRLLCQVEIDKKAIKKQDFYTSADENDLSEHIASKVDFIEDEEASDDFIRFLDQYLFSKEEIKPIHPYLFNYITYEDKQKNEFKKYAQFMGDTLASGNRELREIFKNKNTEDILTELILSQLDALKEAKPSDKQYQQLVQPLITCYQEDLLYLSKYKDYFLASFPVLTHFYTLIYSCQLLLKFEQFTKANFDEVHPLYFALEWESINKRRKAADDLEGFKFIKEKAKNLFPHIHTISHLSHNALNKESSNDRFQFIPYSILYKKIQDRGEAFEKAFLRELKNWIEDYKNLPFTGVSIPDNSDSIPEAFEVLFECLKDGMSTGVCEKYGRNIEDLASNQFLKSRGSLGQVLNIKHDFLLLITAVSVKDKRIPLNDLFKEFEKRGIALDRYSKKEVVKLFDNLNIIDKKSDSGDAQYVKPIL
ncbi:DNA phosphorothioation-dependent restriction protein DptG [Bacillus lacus]|uniref:DNA phosphorothioation-dependent restriction protein DptG n=1 Tax=Metabacillus lacus TaxID=1983721 RepID=A0A7X2M0N2_9BACI|nr:DNA phosphorothioation-dependent restriction protein DptG [Metabacillus lacus]MRX73054.1 DNA phosphorothioation-dependent restriction protein DptG [Metabacillus lacus]